MSSLDLPPIVNQYNEHIGHWQQSLLANLGEICMYVYVFLGIISYGNACRADSLFAFKYSLSAEF